MQIFFQLVWGSGGHFGVSERESGLCKFRVEHLTKTVFDFGEQLDEGYT
jgi:hypothetical protein